MEAIALSWEGGGVVGASLRSPGMGDIPSSARFASHRSKNVSVLLEYPTFDVVKDVLVVFQDPKAVLKC